MTDTLKNDDVFKKLDTSIRDIKSSEDTLNQFLKSSDLNLLLKEFEQKQKCKILIKELISISNNLDIKSEILKSLPINKLNSFCILIDKIARMGKAHEKDTAIKTLNEIIELYDEIYEFIQYLKLTTILFKGDGIESIVTIRENAKSIEQTRSRMDEILTGSASSSAAADVAISHNFFGDSSRDYDIFSIKWAKIVLGLFVITTGLALYLYFYGKEPPTDIFELTVYLSNKIVIFGLLIYAIVFSGRIYIANWHNYAINKHKQNALQTFVALVHATKDADKKDIILTYAANCIYSQQETGFNNQSSGGSNPSEQVAKVAEAIAKLAPKTSA